MVVFEGVSKHFTGAIYNVVAFSIECVDTQFLSVQTKKNSGVSVFSRERYKVSIHIQVTAKKINICFLPRNSSDIGMST